MSDGHSHNPPEPSEGADHEVQPAPRKRRVDRWTVIQTVTGLLLLAFAVWEAVKG